MNIEVLVVPDCPHQAAATALIQMAVSDTRVSASLTTRTINDVEEAQRRAFAGSPTILLNGRDPFAVPDAPVGLGCRVYPTPTGLPSLRDLRQALKREAASGTVPA